MGDCASQGIGGVLILLIGLIVVHELSPLELHYHLDEGHLSINYNFFFGFR